MFADFKKMDRIKVNRFRRYAKIQKFKDIDINPR